MLCPVICLDAAACRLNLELMRMDEAVVRYDKRCWEGAGWFSGVLEMSYSRQSVSVHSSCWTRAWRDVDLLVRLPLRLFLASTPFLRCLRVETASTHSLRC